jgi:hypothetical protein
MASIHWPSGLRIAGSLTTGALTLQLERDLDWPIDLTLTPARAVLTGSAWIDAPPEIAPAPLTGRGVIIAAGGLRLAGLHLRRGTLLSLERVDDGSLRIAARGAAGSVMLEASGSLVLKLDEGGPLSASLNEPAILAAGIGSTAVVPLVLSVASRVGPAIEDVPVALLGFSTPQAAGGGEMAFSSSIIGGTVKLVDTGRLESLERGAALGIEGFHGAIARLDGAEEGWHVAFTGRASRLRLGPPGFAEDLTPSVLEYLYHQEWIKMMWASALAGLAALAEVRSWFGTRRG